ncbi:NUDIX domain-containing protein [Legionella sp. MW5194]|nr:NUDIX domain-containing protein [Legionella sp. MW5194]
MMSNEKEWFKTINEIQAIAQNGLAYCKNEFDQERYLRLRELAAQLAAPTSEKAPDIAHLFSFETGYATPKLDVRAFIVKNHKILLAQEKSDGLWSLPGGWVDVNESPSESVIRETREETGFHVKVIRLMALWDKLKHDHPPQWPHAYKCFFHCDIESGEVRPDKEIAQVDFFAIETLPPLSIHRVTEKQLQRLYETIGKREALFD